MRKVFTNLDKNKLAAIEPLIDNAAFMAVTLENLQEKIGQKGVVEKYKNGENQHGTKQSTEIKVYIALVSNLNNISKLLADFAPPEERKGGKLAALQSKRK